jgi:large subunit ribosomal protein L6|tara:strand:+ start:63 stop:590 length:528 start_codon:yes stop_codon:yes gene_type:complete
MSKVARKPVAVPENIKFSINLNEVQIEGPLGKLSFIKNDKITITEKDGKLSVNTKDESFMPLSGTTRALLYNMIHGVSKGWIKKLQLVGVGYRAKTQGKSLELVVGYSHPVNYPIPDDLKIETPSQTEIVISGADRQKVGQAAAEIRSIRSPEPYKGKGIRYEDEHIVKKEAKKK